MTNKYEIGDLVRVTGTFTDAAGDNTDPTVVRGKYQDPTGNETTDSSPTNSAVGVYYFDIDIDESGTWYYRFEGESAAPTSTPQGAGESHFKVSESQF